MRTYTSVLLILFLVFVSSVRVLALATSPAQSAETVRNALLQAQIALNDEPTVAQKQLALAKATYVADLMVPVRTANALADVQVMANLVEAQQALTSKDAPAFAAARAQIWTAILFGSYTVVDKAIQQGNATTAQTWLAVREFRTATRLSRPGVDATLAVARLMTKTSSPTDVLLAVHADLLDTYQGRLNEVLNDLVNANDKQYAMRRAEHAALAEGYFAILSSSYGAQRGAAAQQVAQQAFAQLLAAAVHSQDITPTLATVQTTLHNFRAAPLSEAEKVRRAGQLLRYLSLVPVEYRRGVANGRVNRMLEVQEAMTFWDGAAAAFADLQNLLDARNVQQTVMVKKSLAILETQLLSALAQTQVTAPDTIQMQTDQIITALKTIMPVGWQTTNESGNFDMINSMLDQVEKAVLAGQYDLAESILLETYAVLEWGPEVKLATLAPQLKIHVEDLFWNETGSPKGLGYLLGQHAPAKEVKTSRLALDIALFEAQTLLNSR